MFTSRRAGELPPYVFSHIDSTLRDLRAREAGVIDLGRADPDQPAPPSVVAELARSAARPEAHGYPPLPGLPRLRTAVARWYGQRHHVELDPDSEVLILLGSKEGLFHVPLAVCDPADVALVPDPGFPAYRVGAYFAGAEVVSMPLRAEQGYLPDLGSLAPEVLRRARILYLNYPHNPTGATAPLRFFSEAVALARRWGVLLCHDFAFGQSGYDGYRAPSILEVEGARECAVEMISWSKTFCMSGWRLGAAVGNASAIAALGEVESHIHSGVFAPIQVAGAVALEEVATSGFLVALNETYRARRDTMLAALHALGLQVRRSRATPFLWLGCPDGGPSAPYANWLLERTGIAVTPGAVFGAGGEGFLRLSLTAPTQQIEEAAERLRRLGPQALRHPAPELPPDLTRPLPASAAVARLASGPQVQAESSEDTLLGCL